MLHLRKICKGVLKQITNHRVKSDLTCANTSRVFAKNIFIVYSGDPASIWSLAVALKELGVDSLLNCDGYERQEREREREIAYER